MLILLLLPFFAVADDYTVCDTRQCHDIASRFIKHMWPSVSPCDNFHEYVCGAYAPHHNLSAHHKLMEPLLEMQETIDKKLSDLLEANVRDATSREMRLAITYYQSCRNETRKSALGAAPLLDILRDTFGGWSVLRQSESQQSWQAVATQLAKHGVGAIFQTFVWENPHNTKEMIIQVGALQTFIPKHYYYVKETTANETSSLDQYRHYMIDFLTMLGADIFTIDAKVDEIIKFEVALAHVASIDSQDDYGEHGVQMTFGEMSANYSHLNFREFFDQEMRDAALGAIDDATLVQNVAPHFFVALDALIAKTDVATIRDYLKWRAVAGMNKYLSRELRGPLDGLYQILIGTTSDLQCEIETRDLFTTPLAAAFVRDYFCDAERKVVADMVDGLRDAMRHEIDEAEWMDDVTSRAALVKLDAMKALIGVPDSIFNASEIARQYGSIELNEADFLKNTLKLEKVKQFDQWYNMRRSDPDWGSYVLAVNAFYNPHRNQMTLPASILHFPLVEADVPPAVNYGGIGVVIGHEMTHGFDDGGALHNAQGNLENWWDEKTKQEFKNKTKCVIDQYNREKEPKTGLNYNGKLTVGENIADNGGLRMAWQAYKKLNAGDQRIRGMEKISSDQLFFIAHANTWCVNSRKEIIDDLMSADPHTFGAARVNLPLRNLPDFAEAFNCPVGSPMRPSEDEICRVW